MDRPRRLWIGLGLLALLTIAGVGSLILPPAPCSPCSGTGKITVMESHPEAMGSGGSSGRLVEIGCPTCEGEARISLYRRWTSAK
jgi:hypothetical protein